MDDLKVQFGKRLRTLREHKQLIQEKLAEAAHISVDFLSLIERGRNAPSFGVLEKLAKALEVTVKELFDFANDKDG
ncbi:MAG: helix-turn-helix domain-containing protein [Ktedonobacteraceae bacterium]